MSTACPGARESGTAHLPSLGEPASGALIAEDDRVSPVGHDHVEVPPPHRPAGPPALVHPPLVAHGCDRLSIQRSRRAGAVCLDAYAPGRAEDAGSGRSHDMTILSNTRSSFNRAACDAEN